MRSNHNNRISRRKILYGAGATAVGLPFLPSLMPRELRAQSGRIQRFAALFFPNGSTMGQDLAISGSTNSWTLGTGQAALQPYQSQISVFKGLNGKTGGAPDHSRGTIEFLTASKISDQNTPTANISIDQAIADKINPPTALRSLHLGPETYPSGPPADTGWPSGYNVYLSWRSSTSPNPPLEDPQTAFNQIYTAPSGGGGTTTDADAIEAALLAEQRIRMRQSILDHVLDQVNAIEPRLGTEDTAKLDEYLTSVRDVEARLQIAAQQAAQDTADAQQGTMNTGGGSSCGVASPPAANLGHADHTKAMIEIAVLALQCDATRILTYSMDYGFGNKDFSWLGLGSFKHHNLSHSGTAQNYIDAHKGIVQWYYDRFAYYLDLMSNTSDGGGYSLLDNTIVYHGSDVGDAWTHSHANLPITVAGGGAGALNPGRLLDGAGVNYASVLLALGQAMGANITSFGGESSAFSGL